MPNDTLGGAEQYLKMIGTYFANEEYLVDVLFLKRKNSLGWIDLENLINVQMHFTNASSEKRGLYIFLINVWKLRYNKYDFIFTSHVHLTGLLGILCRFGILKKQYFVGRESTLIFDRFRGFKLLLFELHYLLGYPVLDLLICQTDAMLNHFRKYLPRLSNKIHIEVISNPISLSYLYSNDVSPLLPLEHVRIIVAAGRLIREKGFDVLIRAFHGLLEEFPDCRLLIFGEGKEREPLLSLVSELGVEHNVNLMGFNKNVLPYFQVANLCVVSSLVEGFPNVLLQMMSKNVNVVSTLCAGGIENINGVFTAEPGDVIALKEAMKNCFLSDNCLNRRLFDDYLYVRRLENFIFQVKVSLHNSRKI